MTDAEKMGGTERIAEAVSAAAVLAVSHVKVTWEILSRPFLLLWTSLIGVWIGVLPAIGGSAANMMAYDQAKKFSKRPEAFGSGVPEASSPPKPRTTPTSAAHSSRSWRSGFPATR